MYSILSKWKKHNLSFECVLDLFDKIVQPILLYGCEIWGYCNLNLLEKLHMKFCKYILKFRKCTPNFMIYGELGRFPLDINVKVRMITFWAKLVSSHENRIANCMYKLALSRSFPWVKHIEQMLHDCGLSYVWHSQSFASIRWLKNTVKRVLIDQFKQKWHDDMYTSSKGINYRIFKTNHCIENYLVLLPEKLRKIICRYRTCNHFLPIECGRWQNIIRENRICQLCSKNEIGDEYHYLFTCDDNEIKNARIRFLPAYYIQRCNTLKYHQ